MINREMESVGNLLLKEVSAETLESMDRKSLQYKEFRETCEKDPSHPLRLLVRLSELSYQLVLEMDLLRTWLEIDAPFRNALKQTDQGLDR